MSGDAGRIVTFYSYKGGTGRTMALANTAWILASNGLRVLAVDWDLDSPGLHKYFHPFLDHSTVFATPGMADLITGYSQDYKLASASGQARRADRVAKYTSVLRNAVSLNWSLFPGVGTLDFLSAGRQRGYAPVDWDDFYWEKDGSQVISDLCADMRNNYDYVLIDSQSGIGGIAEVCTERIPPDVVVACFTLSSQSIEGTASVARVSREPITQGSQLIRILPVPMRVDDSEPERLKAGRHMARERLVGLPNGFDDHSQAVYWETAGIPYKPFYAFEETLAVFADPPGSPASLLAAFERLTSSITDGKITTLPPMAEQLRLAWRDSFARQPGPPGKARRAL